MLPTVVSVGGLAAGSANLYVTSATPVSATALTLTGSKPDVARRVLLTYGNEASARTLALVGTNSSGAVIKETLAVPSGGSGTVYTVQDFASVTSAVPAGGGWTAAVTLGTNGVASSDWKVADYHLTPVNIAIGCVVVGTATYTIEYTYDDLNALALSGNQGFPAFTVPTVFALSTLLNKAATADGFINDPVWAWRLTIVSGATAGSSVTAKAIQGGISQGGT